MDKQLLYYKWKLYQFYIIAGIVSLVMLFFIPMIGSDFTLTWSFPTSAGGWVVYITSKLLAVGLNFVIFHCFVCQAKTNSKDHPNYIKACEILQQQDIVKELKPRSPKQFFGEVYGKKGTMLAISTLVAALTLSQAVLSFDFITFLTHLFTLLFGLGAGVFQMNQVELFWQEEYLQYAQEVEKAANQAKAMVDESLAVAES